MTDVAETNKVETQETAEKGEWGTVAADGDSHATANTVHQRLRANSSIMQLKKILVANRGEIPIRIFRTAHELSLQTVAVFSYEDRLSMHRQKADEAYVIGKRGQYTPVAAYLAGDEIIKIAKQHGYGFLSENYEFAKKVEEAGLIWVGPSPETINALGDKVSARRLAAKCDVPCVPGTPGPVEKFEEVKSFTDEHGFPIIIKAAFGGGGRGMRVVWKQEELKDAFERATSEAKSAFGNGTVFVERFLYRPKHIEVQLLGDNHGNVVHLYERDCSVQRRHQKVVELAPAKDLPQETRDNILNDAVKLAKSVNYRNAGTAEFLVDQEGRYYFIEINPRIQVEHTITEEITASKDRESILGIHLKNELLDPKVELGKLAEQTPLYSGSDLKNLCVAAALAAVREENELAVSKAEDKDFKLPEKRILMPSHFETAVKEISASISEDMSSLGAIRKFDEQFGDRKGRKKKAAYGFGAGFGEEAVDERSVMVRQPEVGASAPP
ncbi:pyruvate carboxylase [Elasticomyces elasticus]|nr:pyruvate carboxylase [Elasticomyces elasticus]